MVVSVKMLNNKYDEATEYINKYILLKPEDALGYYGRGNCKSFQKDYAGSIQDYDKAISLSPSNGQYYLIRGFIKAEYMALKDEGCKDFELAKQHGAEGVDQLIEQFCK